MVLVSPLNPGSPSQPTNQFLATHVESAGRITMLHNVANRSAHSSEIFSIGVTPSRTVTASGDTSLNVWDAKAENHPLIHTFADAHPLGAHHVVVDITSGGRTAASSGFGQEVVLWDLAEGKEKLRINPQGRAISIPITLI